MTFCERGGQICQMADSPWVVTINDDPIAWQATRTKFNRLRCCCKVERETSRGYIILLIAANAYLTIYYIIFLK